jgi:hypothetical protein
VLRFADGWIKVESPGPRLDFVPAVRLCHPSAQRLDFVPAVSSAGTKSSATRCGAVSFFIKKAGIRFSTPPELCPGGGLGGWCPSG